MKQAMYSVSDSGWIEENNHCWFKKMFLPATSHLRETEAVILFFDGHFQANHKSKQRL